MCWSDNKAIPIVLKKPLRVYKVGTLTVLGNFISLYQQTWYRKNKIMPTVEICPEFMRRDPCVLEEMLWECDTFYIYEGYHSYLTKEMAKYRSNEYDDIGVFEIPAGASKGNRRANITLIHEEMKPEKAYFDYFNSLGFTMSYLDNGDPGLYIMW